MSGRFIEWLSPASYYPDYWDQLFAAGGVQSSGSASIMSGGTSDYCERVEGDIQRFTTTENFLRRFSSQHASFVVTERVYFCLDERGVALNGPASFPSSSSTEPLPPSLALLNDLYNLYCKPGKHLYCKPGKHLYCKPGKHLYCKPGKHLYCKPGKQALRANGIADAQQLLQIREATSTPLAVQDTLCSHRLISTDKNIFAASFPDILVVRPTVFSLYSLRSIF